MSVVTWYRSRRLLPAVAIAACWAIAITPATAQSPAGGPGLPAGYNAARVVFDGTVSAAKGAPTPLTADVFWCSGDDKASSRALSASELAASYGVLANLDKAAPALPPVIIRTRPIERDAFLGKLDAGDAKAIADSALVRYDPTDKSSKLFADRIVANGPRPITASPVVVSVGAGSAYSPNYVSIFICTDLDTAAVSGRLYFQIKNQQQIDEALRAALDVRKDLPGLTVVKEIEVVGAKAPSNSELRYFFEDDAKIAARIAATISASTASTVAIKRITGYEGKVRRGTLEAWISE